jgi:riboflavin synthase
MFTGIVTDLGTVATVSERPGTDRRVEIATGASLESVAIGASIACSGVCLTVVGKEPGRFWVDVSAETVSRTARGMWAPGAALNLERALKVGDELGGHIVTGHVDGVGTVATARPVDGSLLLEIRAPAPLGRMIAPKGSIAVDGVSLTVNAVVDEAEGTLFSLNIIPHTAAVTTLGRLTPGAEVNLEADVLARYLDRMMEARQHSAV